MSHSTPEPRRLEDATHAVVHRDDEEFAAWPFNAGAWRVGPEHAVVGYFAHDCDYGVEGHLDHRRISTYGQFRVARTRDGGESWAETVVGDFPALSERVRYGPDAEVGPVDVTDPETLLASWSAPDFWADDAQPWVAVSTDAGESWSAPARVPTVHLERVQGRPCYCRRPDGTLLLLLSGAGAGDAHLRPVVFSSRDGGRTWSYRSSFGRSEEYMVICPSPVCLDDGRLLATVRCNPTWDSLWTECYASDDGGRTWTVRSRVTDHGGPGHLSVLSDGRLLCVYGYRRPPYGVRLRLSEDGGRTWGREWILRDDGATPDLGYPRAVELGDGRVLVAYYFNEPEADVPAEGGVRYVAATTVEL